MMTDTLPMTSFKSEIPVYHAEDLTQKGSIAHIVLQDQTYVLRITKMGKLILTK